MNENMNEKESAYDEACDDYWRAFYAVEDAQDRLKRAEVAVRAADERRTS